MGWNIPPEAMQELRQNLAVELRELRQYPDDMTLEEAMELRTQHDRAKDFRNNIIKEKGVRVPYAEHKRTS